MRPLETTQKPYSSEKEFSPTVSVIIPTYNRKDWLRQTLESLVKQDYPPEKFEVLVVDDGSTDGTEEITSSAFPFRLKYFWQTNQGDAAARNKGVLQSRADILLFIDDDILLAPDYLSNLLKEHEQSPCRIVVGTDHLWLEDGYPPPQMTLAVTLTNINGGDKAEEIPFTDVCSNNMSIRREEYLAIGMMSNLGFRGSSIWCDVDFAFRAYKKGYTFYRSARAICWHRDYVAQSLENGAKRMRETAYRAAVLFQKNPDLLPHLAMFTDKTPIAWGQDSPRLIARKMARHIASSRPVLSGMEVLAGVLEKNDLSRSLRDPLYRWIIGGHLFRGYREGLSEFQMRESRP
jgi:glycosyltransferase involved in cell wall biosynthesis